MPDMDALRAWVSYDDDKKNAAALEKRARAKAAELEPQIMESFVADGVSSVRVTLEASNVDHEAEDTIDAVLSDMPIEFGSGHPASAAGAIVSRLREEGLLRDSRPEITKTVFIGSRVWAKPVATGTDDNGEPKATDDDYLRACEALRAAGWGEYVQTRFNIISLSSAIKEEVQNGIIEIPEGADSTTAFDGTIIVEDRPQLNARKAKA